MNNKAISGIVAVILAFGLITFFLAFTYSLVRETGEDYAVNITHSEIRQVLEDTNSSTAMITHIDNAKQEFLDTNIPLDLGFLLMFLIAYGGTFMSARKAAKLGIINVFGLITIGSMLFLFVLSFIEQARDYLFNTFYYNFFNLNYISTPIIDFYINHLPVISFIWFISLILANQFNNISSFIGDNVGGSFEE